MFLAGLFFILAGKCPAFCRFVKFLLVTCRLSIFQIFADVIFVYLVYIVLIISRCIEKCAFFLQRHLNITQFANPILGLAKMFVFLAKMPALQRTNTENWKHIFPENELRSHSPQFPHSCVCERSINSLHRISKPISK